MIFLEFGEKILANCGKYSIPVEPLQGTDIDAIHGKNRWMNSLAGWLFWQTSLH